MEYPQLSEGGASGFFDDNCTGPISSQEVWPNKSRGLGRAVVLGYGILNSHDHFDQQNQNIDVTRHTIENSGQFTTAFPSSQDHLNISTSGPSIQQAPTFYTGNSNAIERQVYHPDT